MVLVCCHFLHVHNFYIFQALFHSRQQCQTKKLSYKGKNASLMSLLFSTFVKRASNGDWKENLNVYERKPWNYFIKCIKFLPHDDGDNNSSMRKFVGMTQFIVYTHKWTYIYLYMKPRRASSFYQMFYLFFLLNKIYQNCRKAFQGIIN